MTLLVSPSLSVPWALVQTCLAACGLLTYGVVLWSLVKNGTYRQSSFFVLAISVGCNDMMTIVNNHVFSNWRLWGILTAHYFVASPTGWMTVWARVALAYLAWGQMCGTFLITANRYTALVRPLVHEKIWKKWVYPLLAHSWLTPVFFSASLPLVTEFRAERIDNVSLATTIVWSNPTVVKVYFSVVVLSAIVAVLISICMYAFAFCTIYRKRHRSLQLSSNTTAGREKSALPSVFVEVKLSIIGATIVIMYGCLITVYMNVATQTGFNYRLAFVYYFISDVNSYLNPFLLLAMSGVVRHAVVRTIQLSCVLPTLGRRRTTQCDTAAEAQETAF